MRPLRRQNDWVTPRDRHSVKRFLVACQAKVVSPGVCPQPHLLLFTFTLPVYFCVRAQITFLRRRSPRVDLSPTQTDLPLDKVVRIIEQKTNSDYPKTTPKAGIGKDI